MKEAAAIIIKLTDGQKSNKHRNKDIQNELMAVSTDVGQLLVSPCLTTATCWKNEKNDKMKHNQFLLKLLFP